MSSIIGAAHLVLVVGPERRRDTSRAPYLRGAPPSSNQAASSAVNGSSGYVLYPVNATALGLVPIRASFGVRSWERTHKSFRIPRYVRACCRVSGEAREEADFELV